MGHKDLRLGQIVYSLVFCNMSFSWLLPLDGFQFIFLLRDSENNLRLSHDDAVGLRDRLSTHAYLGTCRRRAKVDAVVDSDSPAS